MTVLGFVYFLFTPGKSIARPYPQARLKVLKHRDDHVASVMEDAKVKHGSGTFI